MVQKVRGVVLRKWGMLVLDALKGHLTPDIKATIAGSSMNTTLEVILGEYDCTSGGARCLQQLYSERLLTGPCFDPSWKTQETHCDSSVLVDHNSMAVQLTRSDCERF
jgi:hypothetical protein